jgi:hypothetical protein
MFNLPAPATAAFNAATSAVCAAPYAAKPGQPRPGVGQYRFMHALLSKLWSRSMMITFIGCTMLHHIHAHCVMCHYVLCLSWLEPVHRLCYMVLSMHAYAAYSIRHVQLCLRVQDHSGFNASSIFFSLALFCDHPVCCMPSKMVNGLRVTSPTHMLQVSGQPRPGVGQYRFMHALLSRGAGELEALCPGYLQQLQVRRCSM